MSFESLYTKHRDSITERWLPIKVKVMLEEDPEKKISIIRKAQKQAAKEIHDIEVKSTFIEYLEREINWYIKPTLSQNGSAKAQEPVQSNETLNTGESKGQITGEPVEKIDWEAGLAELAFMFEILFKDEEIGCSMKQYKRRWALIAKHFTVKGEEISNLALKSAYSGIKYSESGKIRKHKEYEDLTELAKEIGILTKK